MKRKVSYHPAASPNKPFRIDGKWYARDEAAALGYESECHKAIMDLFRATPDDETVEKPSGSARIDSSV